MKNGGRIPWNVMKVVREETDKTASDIQARSFMARTLTKLGRNAKLREKEKRAIEKPMLDNARRLRGIYFIDPEDKEFKETIRKCSKEIGNINGSRHASQDKQEKQAMGDP